MKANKKGISLIVLVITIIVIIILAAAIILSLNNNNPIAKAKEAVTASDKAEAQSAFGIWLGSKMADYQDSLKVTGEINSSSTVDLVSTTTGETVATGVSCTLSDLGLDGLTSIKVTDNVVTEVKKN